MASGELAAHIKSLYETSRYSDLIVILRGGEILNLHKSIVCRLDFFRAACDGRFKEAAEGRINFPEDPPKAMKALFMHLYGYSIHEIRSRLGKDNKLMITTALNIHNVASKYFATGLVQEIVTMCDRAVEINLEIVCASDSPDEPEKEGIKFVHDFAERVNDIRYDGSDVRANLVRSLQQHMAGLLKKKELAIFVEKRLLSYANIASDLLKVGALDGTGLRIDSLEPNEYEKALLDWLEARAEY